MRKELTDKVNLADVEKYIPKTNIKVWEIENNNGLWELMILWGNCDKVTKQHYDLKKRILYLDFEFYEGTRVETEFSLPIRAGTKKVKVNKIGYCKPQYKIPENPLGR